jgi:hypothetical protein
MYEDIIEDIKSSYNSLWKTKEWGNSVEIITPVSTTNDMFVSVFLTKKNDEYIVTDGGWMVNEIYKTSIKDGDIYFNRLIAYYLEYYSIKQLTGKGLTLYYKKTDRQTLVPNIVYDLSSFISVAVSSTYISFTARREKDEISRFSNQTKDYLRTIAPERRILFNKSISDQTETVKFGAVIQIENGKFTLIEMITGTNIRDFIGSICRAYTNFNIANSSCKDTIRNRVSLVNNQAAGYQEVKITSYLNQLKNNPANAVIGWDERERLKALV